MVVILAMALIPILHYPFALQTNLKVITTQLSNLEFVSSLVALEIALIMLSTYFSIDIIHTHFNTHNGSIKRFFSLFPSVFFSIGIVLLQLWGFNEISGIPYFWLSLSLSVATFVVLLIFVFLSKWALNDWTLRLELKTLLSFFLITGAILLPIFFQRISIVTLDKSQINFNQSLLIIAVAFAVSIIGFFNYKYQITQHIWKRFTKS